MENNISGATAACNLDTHCDSTMSERQHSTGVTRHNLGAFCNNAMTCSFWAGKMKVRKSLRQEMTGDEVNPLSADPLQLLVTTQWSGLTSHHQVTTGNSPVDVPGHPGTTLSKGTSSDAGWLALHLGRQQSGSSQSKSKQGGACCWLKKEGLLHGHLNTSSKQGAPEQKGCTRCALQALGPGPFPMVWE